MPIEILDKNDYDRWNSLVERADDATIGHFFEWREVVNAAYKFESFYILATEQGGAPLAGLPFILVRSRLYGTELASMPYIDYGGVCHSDSLSPEGQNEIDQDLYNYALRLGKLLGAKRLHIRSLRLCDPRFNVSTEKVTQHLTLAKTVEEQLRQLPSERRNRLKRCKRIGLVAEIKPADDERTLLEFCRIYNANMRDLGSPSHSIEFFKRIVHHFKKRIALLVVRHQKDAIAAGIALEFRGHMSLPWTGATAGARPLYGSNALYWGGIRLAIEQGCHTFDFGRSSFGSGIYEFKRQWGPRPHQAYWSTFYFRAGAKPPRERRELRMASALWRRLPLAVTRVVGPHLRKGISN